jgi:hypothetical protein
MRDEVHQKRARLYRRQSKRVLTSLLTGGSLRLRRELMRRLYHLSSWVVLAFSLGGGCMFLVEGCLRWRLLERSCSTWIRLHDRYRG